MTEYRASNYQLSVPPLARGRSWHDWILYMLKEHRQAIITDKEIEQWKSEQAKAAAGKRR